MQLDWIDTLNRRKQTRETYSLWSYLISLKLNLTWSFLHWIVAEEGTYSRVIKKIIKKRLGDPNSFRRTELSQTSNFSWNEPNLVS